MLLSYLQDRPHRWIHYNTEGNKMGATSYSWCEGEGREEAYRGTPIAVVVPKGAYLQVHGVLPPGTFQREGRYKLWVEIVHMPDEGDTAPPGWQDPKGDLWRGLIQSEEVELVVVES